MTKNNSPAPAATPMMIGKFWDVFDELSFSDGDPELESPEGDERDGVFGGVRADRGGGGGGECLEEPDFGGGGGEDDDFGGEGG